MLAVVGFEARPALFIESTQHPGMLETNPAIAQRYFPGRETHFGIDTIPFLAQKPADSIRLVVQGGSTAAGFPYGRFAGLAGLADMLGDRLEAARPDQTIEVVTTAMAAVNSYTLLDFVDEIIAIEPDAVLIYAGHNEYLGIFGAGSALTAQRSRAATRTHLWLTRFRVYQLIDAMIPAAAEASRERDRQDTGRRDTLMARAASSVQIPLGSKLYREGLAQFEENLSAILDAYAHARIPVFISTLASNEVDQSPFVGAPLGEFDAEAFDSTRVSARELLDAGEVDAARSLLEGLVDRHPEAAATRFDLAHLEWRAGNIDEAKSGFRRAKELDRLRFRAPEAMNELVRRLAGVHSAVLVDGQAQLEANSAIGRIGRGFMLEHLHPNARGHFLLADAFYRELEAASVFGDSPTGRVPTVTEAMHEIPLTAIDHLNAAQAVREITSDFPFRPDRVEVPYPEPKGPVAAIAKRVFEDPGQWLAGMEELLQFHLRRHDLRRALVVARVTARSLPGQAAPNRVVGQLLSQQGRPRQAARYLEVALRAESGDLATLQRLRDIREQLGDTAAVALLDARIEALEAMGVQAGKETDEAALDPNKEPPGS